MPSGTLHLIADGYDFGKIATWNDVAWEVAKFPDGSLPMIEIGGHGRFGDIEAGIGTSAGNLLNTNMPPEVADLMHDKLSVYGVIAITSCNGGNSEKAMVDWARRIGRPVVANTGMHVSRFNYGEADWVIFVPPDPLPFIFIFP